MDCTVNEGVFEGTPRIMYFTKACLQMLFLLSQIGIYLSSSEIEIDTELMYN